MEIKPKVYILLATYNRADLIEETLISIQNQTYKNFACLITDDNSTDDTEKVVKAFIEKDGRFEYYRKPSTYPQGLSATRNFGLDLAQQKHAEFIQFFDDDDLMHKEKLEIQMGLILKSSVDLCLCNSYSFSGKLDYRNNKPIVIKSPLSFADDYLLGKIHFGAPIPIFRFSYVNKQRFDLKLDYAEEWVCFTKLFYRYPPKVVYADKVLFFQRKHENSITLGSDPYLKKAKSSAIANTLLYDYLSKYDLHTQASYKNFASIFLFQTHSSKKLNNILIDLKQKKSNSILRIQIWFFKNFLKFQRQIFNKISSWTS